MKSLPARILDEPDLIFARGNIEKDPKLGLDYYGPYHSTDEPGPSPTQMRVGIIGTGENIELASRILSTMSNRVISRHSNRWVHPDFPGINQQTKIRCDILQSPRWNAAIKEKEIEDLNAVANVNERIAACANLYVQKIRQVLIESDLPNVFICALSSWVEDYCGSRSEITKGASRPKPTPTEKMRMEYQSLAKWGVVEEPTEPERDFDLHNAMKGKSMEYGIPIQILRESVANKFLKSLLNDQPLSEGVQGPSDFAWNLSTALYYKSEGRPWRLARLMPGTCYVGISFFRNLRSYRNDLQFSMAQVFTHSLEGFVIRGTEVTVDERTSEAHMSERQSFDLLNHAIEKYRERVGTKPDRVVIHKTSFFSPEEKRGVLRVIGDVRNDLVSFSRGTPYRFLRLGNFPVLRGTLISLSQSEHLLYTSGYTPRLRTYPGARAPEPLLIAHSGQSGLEIVCREILGLTKLDWNTTSFSTRVPITIGFAQRVGDVLSELKDDAKIQDHYKFYM